MECRSGASQNVVYKQATSKAQPELLGTGIQESGERPESEWIIRLLGRKQQDGQ
jgi:hypothetical protein